MTWLTQRHFKWRLCLLMGVILAISVVSIGYAQASRPQSGIDASSGLHYLQLTNPDWSMESMALRPDGQAIAVSETSGQIDILNDQLQRLGKLVGHRGTLWTMDWSPNGTEIASGGSDATVRVWNANTFSNILTLHYTADIIAVAWSPDGTQLAAVESKIVSWDSDANAYTDDTLRVWNMTVGSVPTLTVHYHNSSSSVSWSPDGREIAVGGGMTLDDDGILIWDAKTGALVKQYPRAWSTIVCVAWSPDGRQIAYGDSGNEAGVYLIDVTTGTQTVIPDLRSFDNIVKLAWDPNGRELAEGTVADTAVELIDIPTQNYTRMDGHPDSVGDLDWSADGSDLASLSDDGTIILWDMRGLPDLSGTPTVTLPALQYLEPTATRIPKP